MDAGGDDEAALFGGIGDVGEESAAFGGDTDAVIGETVVGGGEDEEDAGEICSAKAAADQAEGEVFKFGLAFRGDDGDPRAGLQQAASFAKCDFTGADDEDGAILQIEKDGIVFQSQNVTWGEAAQRRAPGGPRH